MHLYLSFTTVLCLRLLLPHAQGTASCLQTRSSNFPQATDVASLINTQASSVCSQLQAATLLPLSASFQGYGLRTNGSSSSFDTLLCQNVLSNIAQSCVLSASYYGGLYFSQRQMFNLSNTIYPQNPILSGLGASQASSTTSSPSSSQVYAGGITTQSQSSAGTTSSQPQNGWISSPSSPPITSVAMSTNSTLITPVISSSPSGQSVPYTSQISQGSNSMTATSLGWPPSQTISGYATVPSASSIPVVSNGDFSTSWTSSLSQAAGNGTSFGPQLSTSSITGQLASISGSVTIPNSPIDEYPPATYFAATITELAAAASATQAVASANSTIANLQSNPDSQDAKQAALDAINDAETAAKVAAIAWLLSALGPAVAEAELVVAGTAPVSDLVAAWATVEAAEQKVEEGDEAESASLSIASQTPSSSPPSPASYITTLASSTLSSTSSAVSGTCALYTYPSDDEIDEGPGEDNTGELTGTSSKRRARIRRFKSEAVDETLYFNPARRTIQDFVIERRATGSSFTSINGCSFPNRLSVTQPNYLTAGQLYKVGQPKQIGGSGGKNGLIYNAVQKWYFGTHDCTVEPGFAWSKVAYWYPGMLASKQSVDHVWELNLLTLFLTSMIGTSSFSCDDMTTVFFPGTAACDNKMQIVFNQLPSMDVKNIQNGFIALEQSVNGIKGYIFSQGLGTSPYYISNRANTFQNQVGALQDACMAFAILSQPEVKVLYDLTNNRIYQAFLGVDALITNNALKDTSGAPLQANWGSSFKTWMTNHLDTISGDAWSWAEALLSQLQEDTNNDATLSSDQKTFQLKQLSWIENGQLWGEDQFTLDFDLSWTVGTLALGCLASTSSSSKATTSALVAGTLGSISTSSSVAPPASTYSAPSTPATSSGVSGIPTTSATPTVTDNPTAVSTALIASIESAAAATHICPSSSYSNTTNFVETMPQGTNTFNLDFDAITHPEILVPGTQWMFAEVDGYLSEWSVMGSPVQPDVMASNGTFIQFEIPLDVDMTSIVVIGVSIPGLTDRSAYPLNLYAWGAASIPCGGTLPLSLIPAAPPSAPQIPTTTASIPSTTTEPAYGPTESSSCAGGSSLCRSNSEMGSMCQTAYARYVDNFIYTNYTSLTYTNAANEAFTGDGCSAFFQCGAAGSSSQPYAAGPYPSGGMSGADMKTAFGLIGCSVCGWHDLAQTGCQVKLDACSGCVDWVNGVNQDPTTVDPEPWCNESKC